jgi:hypothetical protein
MILLFWKQLITFCIGGNTIFLLGPLIIIKLIGDISVFSYLVYMGFFILLYF